MLSSRNIHLALLGIILGATSGYVFAFYQAEQAVPPASVINHPQAGATAQAQGSMPPNHPDVGASTESLESAKKAADSAPDDSEARARYGSALFKAGRVEEAVAEYEKALQLNPDNLDLRSLRAAVLWSMGKSEDARIDLEAGLKRDPNHIPSLYGLFLVTVGQQDVEGASKLLARVEKLDPKFEGLEVMRQRLAEAKKNGAK